MAFLLSLEGIQRRDLDTEAKLFAALGQPSSHARCQTYPAPGPTSGPWDDPPLASGPRYR